MSKNYISGKNRNAGYRRFGGEKEGRRTAYYKEY
jgi:hypothetical protein